MKFNKPFFIKILELTVQKNAERIISKTRLTNGLAKKLCGANRRMASHAKSITLCFLVKKLSNQVRMSKEFRLTDFVVELKTEKSGLHLPLANLIS